jgi:TonB family protein
MGFSEAVRVIYRSSLACLALFGVLVHTGAVERPIVQADGDGITPLMRAARDGEVWKIRDLVQSGDINAKDRYGWTALIYAAEKGDLESLSTLLSHSADPNVKDESGNTALMYAAEEGRLDQVNAMLRSSPDINAANDEGLTALNFALRKGRADAAEALRQAGATEHQPASATDLPRPLRPKAEKMDRNARAKHIPSPQYTPDALANKVSGIIRVRVLVDPQGKVQKIRIIAGLPYGLSDEAVRVAQKMTFSPATKRGQPVESWVGVDLSFKAGK